VGRVVWASGSSVAAEVYQAKQARKEMVFEGFVSCASMAGITIIIGLGNLQLQYIIRRDSSRNASASISKISR
jgi:hypothetical protein